MSSNDRKENIKEEILLFIVDALRAHEREMDRLIKKLENVKNQIWSIIEKEE